jgi:multidrug transporter EmrE-like cation transporter
MEGRMLREIVMILFVNCSTMGSQLLIKRAVTQLALRNPVPTGADWLLAALLSPPVMAAIAIQGIGFVVWVVVVSRVKLGVAFAIAGGTFYLLMAMATWFVYGERLSLGQWAGLALISSGVLMVSQLGSSN